MDHSDTPVLPPSSITRKYKVVHMLCSALFVHFLYMSNSTYKEMSREKNHLEFLWILKLVLCKWNDICYLYKIPILSSKVLKIYSQMPLLVGTRTINKLFLPMKTLKMTVWRTCTTDTCMSKRSYWKDKTYSVSSHKCKKQSIFCSRVSGEQLSKGGAGDRCKGWRAKELKQNLPFEHKTEPRRQK